jgi:RNA ligase
MIHYEFPEIRSLDDVLPHIEGAKEFIHAVKDGYSVVNYAVSTPETFGDPQTLTGRIRRECRGLIFSENGEILARRFHKFFNVNEREETLFSAIDFDQPHAVMIKYDGSMISPIAVRGHIRWASKMGITDTSMQAEAFVARNPVYNDFAAIMMAHGYTPIFEWMSPDNRIVIDYSEESLVLLAVRETVSGKYVPMARLVHWGNKIPLGAALDGNFGMEYMESIRLREDIEGVVIRFSTGHMVKVKADDYVLRHKSKDMITREKSVLQLIFNDQVDDVLPMLTSEDAEKIRDFERKVLGGISNRAEWIATEFSDLKKAFPTKKEFAIATSNKEVNGQIRAIMFGMYDGRGSAEELLLDLIRKNLSSLDKIEGVRILWGNFRWMEKENE